MGGWVLAACACWARRIRKPRRPDQAYPVDLARIDRLGRSTTPWAERSHCRIPPRLHTPVDANGRPAATAEAVAEAVALDGGTPASAVDAPELDTLDANAVRSLVRDASVFSRVSRRTN